jgi:hypothetical protein
MVIQLVIIHKVLQSFECELNKLLLPPVANCRLCPPVRRTGGWSSPGPPPQLSSLSKHFATDCNPVIQGSRGAAFHFSRSGLGLVGHRLSQEDTFLAQGRYVPRMFRPCTFCPCTICPRTLFPAVFMSPYFSSIKESQPTEHQQPIDYCSWTFSLT